MVDVMQADGRIDDGDEPTAPVYGPADVVVLYEDEHLLAVNKPAGLVVHPSYKHPDGTLADAVFARQAERGEGRPWLLHRLDRGTSGVLLFAKTEAARRSMVRQIEARALHKRYLAITAGIPRPPDGLLDGALARDLAHDRRRSIVVPDGEGTPALTRYTTLATHDEAALVLAEPITGRTHQIRAHLTSVGAPLVGDTLYLPEGHWAADAQLASRAMLHAYTLGCRYPTTGQPFTLPAPMPNDMQTLLQRLRLEAGLSRLALLDEETPCN